MEIERKLTHLTTADVVMLVPAPLTVGDIVAYRLRATFTTVAKISSKS